jgi:hypothetical protein
VSILRKAEVGKIIVIKALLGPPAGPWEHMFPELRAR